MTGSNPSNYPLPWRDEGLFVIAKDGRSVCKCHGEREAQLITAAVNYYLRTADETPAAPDDELNAWQRPSALGFSYEQVRGMDDGEAIKAGLDSGDRLAHELANRLDLARGEQLRPMSCECEFDDYQAWQYKRICLFCGHEWYGLHCPHDGHQNPCPSCGKRPEVVPESRS
jgi:hypothetical protein